jgi:hypothetical protein
MMHAFVEAMQFLVNRRRRHDSLRDRCLGAQNGKEMPKRGA